VILAEDDTTQAGLWIKQNKYGFIDVQTSIEKWKWYVQYQEHIT